MIHLSTSFKPYKLVLLEISHTDMMEFCNSSL